MPRNASQIPRYHNKEQEDTPRSVECSRWSSLPTKTRQQASLVASTKRSHLRTRNEMNSRALIVNRDVHSHWASLKDQVLGGHDSIASIGLEDLYEDSPQVETHHESIASMPSLRRHSGPTRRHSANCTVSSASNRQMSHGLSPRRRRRKSDYQNSMSLRSSRSCSVNLEGSVSFSSTKLGQLLNSSGFKVERDFEVESISPELFTEPPAESHSPRSPRRGSCGRPSDSAELCNSPIKAQSRSPRSPRRRSCSRSQGPKPKYSDVSSNEVGAHHHDMGSGRISPCMKSPRSPHQPKSDLWRSRLVQSGKLAPTMKNSSVPSVDMSKTKLGKILTQQGLKLNQGPAVTKEMAALATPVRTRKPTIRRERKARNEEEPACPKASTTTTIVATIVDEEPALAAETPTSPRATPTRNDSRSSSPSDETASTATNSDSSEDVTAAEPAAPVAPTVVDPAVISEDSPTAAEPIADVESFVPINKRVPVEVLKDLMKKKAAKKQEMINKIKSLDAKLSTMLTACHEASRKLKMMEELSGTDVSEVSDFTEISDVSEF